MKALFIEGKREEVVHTEDDLCLFRAPRKGDGGFKYPSGEDLFVHKTQSGKEVYYLLDWSLRPKKREEIIQISPGMAERFLGKRGIFCNSTSKEDQKAIETMQQYGWGILEEF